MKKYSKIVNFGVQPYPDTLFKLYTFCNIRTTAWKNESDICRLNESLIHSSGLKLDKEDSINITNKYLGYFFPYQILLLGLYYVIVIDDLDECVSNKSNHLADH